MENERSIIFKNQLLRIERNLKTLEIIQSKNI